MMLMPTPSHKTWDRSRLVAASLTYHVVLALVLVEVAPHRGSYAGQGKSPFITAYGWPNNHATLTATNMSYSELEWDFSALSLNLAICFSLIASTLFACTDWARSLQRRQFTLHSLCYFVVVAAILFALLSGQLERTIKQVGLPYIHLIDWQTVLRPMGWPLLLGVAATIYTMLRILATIVSGSRVLLAPLYWDKDV
jgi:hypothetical protein